MRPARPNAPARPAGDGDELTHGRCARARRPRRALIRVLILLWALSPTAAYFFSELLEGHAVDTYGQVRTPSLPHSLTPSLPHCLTPSLTRSRGQFTDENEALLKQLPAPSVARKYYQSEVRERLWAGSAPRWPTPAADAPLAAQDLYLFDEFQTSMPAGTRRPVVNTLYDTFANIRDDEGEHVKTMIACQDEDALVASPNRLRGQVAVAASTLLITSYLLRESLPDELPFADAIADFLPFI